MYSHSFYSNYTPLECFYQRESFKSLISTQLYPYSLGTDTLFSGSQIEAKFDNIKCD